MGPGERRFESAPPDTDDDIAVLCDQLLRHEAALTDPLAPAPRRARDQAQADRLCTLIERHQRPPETA